MEQLLAKSRYWVLGSSRDVRLHHLATAARRITYWIQAHVHVFCIYTNK